MCFKTDLKTFPEIINKVTEREETGKKDKNRLSSQETLHPNKGDYRKHSKVRDIKELIQVSFFR